MEREKKRTRIRKLTKQERERLKYAVDLVWQFSKDVTGKRVSRKPSLDEIEKGKSFKE